jgi:uncharacterized protein (TIGR03435 family)
MKVSPNQNEPVSDLPWPRGAKGPPSHPGPWCMLTATPDGQALMISQQQTMQDLTQQLARMLDSVVTDGTELTARYDFKVTYAGHIGPGGALRPPSSPAGPPEAGEPLPDIFSALSEQLGLELEKKKVHVKDLVVDHAEKMPTSN